MDGLSMYDALQAYDYLGAQPQADEFRHQAAPGGALSALTAACFLLYQPEQVPGAAAVVSAGRFIIDTAPVLLQQLSRVTESQRVTLHGRTRGRVDWSSTYKTRYAEDTNPTVFVCQQSWRRFDRPENQLVKYLFMLVQDCIRRIPLPLWSWQAWGEQVRKPGERAGEPAGSSQYSLGDLLVLLSHRLRTYRTYAALQDVALPPAIETRHILAARTSKNEMYAQAADLYEQYQAVVGWPVWERWTQVLGGTLPLPATISGVVAQVLRAQVLQVQVPRAQQSQG